MADVVSAQVRSRMMAGIRGKNTSPELFVRSALHKRGFRFRLHAKDLPGQPDIVLPKWNAVIFVHGCFWHAHNCHLFRLPSTRQEWWREKLAKNRQLDKKSFRDLRRQGWRVLSIYECALKGRERLPSEDFLHSISEWLIGGKLSAEIRGNPRKEAIKHP